MRHLTAREHGAQGGWHYVSMGRDGGHPLGACAGHPPHDTEDDARRCFRAYQRSQVKVDRTVSWTSCERIPCPRPAHRAARIEGDGYALAALCDDHCTVEDAIVVLGLEGELAGDSWQS